MLVLSNNHTWVPYSQELDTASVQQAVHVPSAPAVSSEDGALSKAACLVIVAALK